MKTFNTLIHSLNEFEKFGITGADIPLLQLRIKFFILLLIYSIFVSRIISLTLYLFQVIYDVQSIGPENEEK